MKKDAIDLLQADWLQQRPDLDPEPFGVVLRVQALARMFMQQAETCLAEVGMQWWQYDLLSALRRRGEPFIASASELANDAMLSSGATTNRIDRLQRGGLVKRLRDKQDRRKVMVGLTPKGRKMVDLATVKRFEAASNALTGMRRERRSELSDLLRQVMLNQDDAAMHEKV